VIRVRACRIDVHPMRKPGLGILPMQTNNTDIFFSLSDT
jgi:hypothetical protein